jgi:integral membrane protein
VLAFDLARRARWDLGRTVLFLLAGTVPFMSFVAERKATHLLQPASAVHYGETTG